MSVLMSTDTCNGLEDIYVPDIIKPSGFIFLHIGIVEMLWEYQLFPYGKVLENLIRKQ